MTNRIGKYVRSTAALAVTLAAVGAEAKTSRETYVDAPAMTVYSDVGAQVGRISPKRIWFERTGEDAPLRVDHSDDIALGSEIDMRYSFWAALITAGLERMDTLRGVRARIDVHGLQSGPSAGGVYTLSLLTMMDGREFPSDFAMTGTILPDGTIGVVGGVDLKLKGAIAAGKRRFCIPATSYFEYNEQEQRFVDLMRIGYENGVEIQPVWDIEEAYAFAHRLPVKPAPVIDEEKTLALDPEAQIYLGERCIELAQRMEAVKKSLGDGAIKALAADPLLRSILFDSSYFRYFRSGRVLAAEWKLSELLSAWEAAGEWMARVNELNAKYPVLLKDRPFTANDRKRFIDALKGLAADVNRGYASLIPGTSLSVNLSDGLEYRRTDRSEPLISAQEIHEADNAVNALAMFKFLDVKATAWQKMQNPPDALLETSRDIQMVMELCRIFRAKQQARATDPERLRRFYGKSGKLKSVADLGAKGDFFYSAVMAAHSGIITDLAVYKKLTDKEAAMNWVCGIDSDATVGEWMKNQTVAVGYAMRKRNRESYADYEYTVVREMVYGAKALAKLNALVMKYGPDVMDVNIKNGVCTCTDPAFMGGLARRARQKALEAIAACRARGIPCPTAILDFQFADGYDVTAASANNILHEVVEKYWSAGLTAKALMLAFRKD